MKACERGQLEVLTLSSPLVLSGDWLWTHTFSFSSLPYGSEEDMRFVYCACAISHLLDDWSGVDTAAVVRYVNSCLVRSFEPVCAS